MIRGPVLGTASGARGNWLPYQGIWLRRPVWGGEGGADKEPGRNRATSNRRPRYADPATTGGAWN